MAFELLSGIGSVLGGLGGLFGSKKKKDPTPRENLLSQAQGARQAADKYGFNPLTMLQYGQVGGAMGGGGGAPPLASIELITSGLKDINDVTSGDAARRRAADELELDLAKVKIDQAKNQIALDHAQLMRTSAAPLGRRAVTIGNQTVRDARPVMRPSTIFGRDIDREDMVNTSGVGQIENPILGPQPYYVPMVGSDGLDEIASAGAAVAYQKQVEMKQQLADDLQTVDDTWGMSPENVEWTDALTPQWKPGRKPDVENPDYKAAKQRVWKRTGPHGGFGTGVWRRTVPLWNYNFGKWMN